MNILEFDEKSMAAKDDLQATVRKYLVDNGWKYNSDNPGSILLWTITRVEKEEVVEPAELEISDSDVEVEPDGTIIVRTMRRWSVNESTALQFQRYWELEERAFPTHADDCPVFETFDWDTCTCMPGGGE